MYKSPPRPILPSNIKSMRLNANRIHRPRLAPIRGGQPARGSLVQGQGVAER